MNCIIFLCKHEFGFLVLCGRVARARGNRCAAMGGRGWGGSPPSLRPVWSGDARATERRDAHSAGVERRAPALVVRKPSIEHGDSSCCGAVW